MNAGDTFKLQGAGHIWIVVSDPARNSEKVVIAIVTSNKTWQDQSCVIRRGEHECAHSADVVVYDAKSKLRSNSELDAMLSAGQIRLGARLGDQLLSRVREGAEKSAELPFDVQRVLIEQGLINP